MAKLITLAAPIWSDVLQRSIMPIEGPQIVSDERAAELIGHGVLDGDPIDIPEDNGAPAPRTKAKGG